LRVAEADRQSLQGSSRLANSSSFDRLELSVFRPPPNAPTFQREVHPELPRHCTSEATASIGEIPQSEREKLPRVEGVVRPSPGLRPKPCRARFAARVLRS